MRVNTVAVTMPSGAIRDLIDGWYGWCGGVGAAGCRIDDVNYPAIPSGAYAYQGQPTTCGWNLGTGDWSHPLLYQAVLRVFCRTCHIAHADLYNLQNFKSFNTLSATINSVVFNTTGMPFAEVPFNRLWADQAAWETLWGFIKKPGVDPYP